MIIQSLWVGPDLGLIPRLSIGSFLAAGHEFRLYTYGEVTGVPDGVTTCDASAILPEQEIFYDQEGFGRGSPSPFSDWFRYKLLFDHGGWWVDTDVVCLKPLPSDQEYVFASQLSAVGAPEAATCAFMAPAGCDLLRYCLEVCESKDKERVPWGQIGPDLLEDAIWRFGLARFQMPVHSFCPVSYKDFADFTNPGFDFDRLVDSYGVHLWQQMWKATGTNPASEWPTDSLIGMLKERYLVPVRRRPGGA